MADIKQISVQNVTYDVKDQTARDMANQKAPLASPAFTGVPTAPTPVKGTDTTQIATTAFVQTAMQDAGKVKSVNGQTGDVIINKSSVGLGNVENTKIAPVGKTTDMTQSVGIDSDGKLYTTPGSGGGGGDVTSVDGQTGAVVTNAVKYTTQNLTTVQKQRARLNIGAGTSSFDGSYNSLTDAPTIPTKTSELTNDSGFLTEAPVISVNGKIGAVNVTKGDVGLDKVANVKIQPVTKTDTMTQDVGVDSNGRLYTVPSSGGGGTGGAVDSVNGKTGAVILDADDVGAIPLPTSVPSNQWLKTDNAGAFILSQLPSASTGLKGITYLVDSYTRTDTDKAVTPKALNQVYNMIPNLFIIDIELPAWISWGEYTDSAVSDKTAQQVFDAYNNGDLVVAWVHFKNGGNGYLAPIMSKPFIDSGDYDVRFSAVYIESPDTSNVAITVSVIMGQNLDTNEAMIARQAMLPIVTSADTGKVMMVNSSGDWVAATLPTYDGGVS